MLNLTLRNSHYSHQVPQQKNDYDCGIFVLYFMERFIEDAPERLKKKDLARVQCFYSLIGNSIKNPTCYFHTISFHMTLCVNTLNCQFTETNLVTFEMCQFGKQWFRPEEASRLRAKIRNVLHKEFQSVAEVDSQSDSSSSE